VVSWDVVARQYDEAHARARASVRTREPVVLPLEF